MTKFSSSKKPEAHIPANGTFREEVYKLSNGQEEQMHHIGIIYKVELNASGKLKTEADGEDSHGARWLKIADLSKDNMSPFANQCINIQPLTH